MPLKEVGVEDESRSALVPDFPVQLKNTEYSIYDEESTKGGRSRWARVEVALDTQLTSVTKALIGFFPPLPPL